MDYLPLFAELKEKPVLVIGGGDIAARKIMFLRRAGANVQVVAAALSEEVAALVERQEIQWRAHEFEEQQLDDVFLAIAATDDDALNQRVSAAANARYRLVNVVDNQPLCSVVCPSIPLFCRSQSNRAGNRNNFIKKTEPNNGYLQISRSVGRRLPAGILTQNPAKVFFAGFYTGSAQW